MRKNNRVQGTGYRVQGTEKRILADNRILNPEPCPLNPEKGFTLIELMTSASILGLIGLAILTTFASGFHVYERVQSFGGLQADVLLSLEEMERDLSNTFPFLGIGVNGEAREITFPAMIEAIELVEGEETAVLSVGRVSYYLDSEGEQKTLVRNAEDYSGAGSDDKSGEGQSRSLTYVKDLTLSYYFFDEENQEYVWKESWSEEEGLPEAVKIELTYEDRGRDIALLRTVFVPAVRVVDNAEESEEGEEDSGA